jgi:hypothetical protein
MKVNVLWKGIAKEMLHPSGRQILLLLSTRKDGLELNDVSALPNELAVIVAIDILKPLSETSAVVRSRLALIVLAPLTDSRSDLGAVTDKIVRLVPLGTADDDILIRSPTSSTLL